MGEATCAFCAYVAPSPKQLGVHHSLEHRYPAPAYVNNDGIWCCGEDFMAGTICSMAPGHSGPHGTTCQACGGDWMAQTCTCTAYCVECGAAFEHDGDRDVCDDCRCQVASSVTGAQCFLADNHWGAHLWRVESRSAPPTEEELAEVYRSLGAAPPHEHAWGPETYPWDAPAGVSHCTVTGCAARRFD